ncbi:adenosylcobinamide-GDP ribazoletransferase [Tengunoibacter tsumagoiensis]|nr:adenosylcobinamide-GDP ribazoletransferase [Tengunoibacter tsumagoiensis]
MPDQQNYISAIDDEDDDYHDYEYEYEYEDEDEDYATGRGVVSKGQIMDHVIDQCRELVAAIRFLSTIPIPGSAQLFEVDLPEPRLIIGSAYFPWVGLLLGGILYLATLLLEPWLPSLALSALLVVALILLTGGLHLDGLMDSCDGIFGGTTRERKLEIMRDSRVGSFGVLGGVSLLLLKFSLVASLSHTLLPLAFVLVLPISRWSMVLAIYLAPSARTTGLGAATKQTVTRTHLIIAGVSALFLVLLIGKLIGLYLWLGGCLLAVLLALWMTRKLGGLTGDSYGAIAEVTEVGLLLLLVLLHF